ncbi:hypothetical protein BGZ63DRAFT_113273 [Mariannaea sp. PMI_226]|nr:hypothetical protein BGZ63DRAFT_113273 [Mariannaea sp. PMI_226]
MDGVGKKKLPGADKLSYRESGVCCGWCFDLMNGVPRYFRYPALMTRPQSLENKCLLVVMICIQALGWKVPEYVVTLYHDWHLLLVIFSSLLWRHDLRNTHLDQ